MAQVLGGAPSVEGGRLRSITDAEKQLIWALLSGADTPPTLRPLPRSTQFTALGRIRSRGWVGARILPNPLVVGWANLTIAVAQPFVDRMVETARSWRNQESCALLWNSHRTLVGAFYNRSDREGAGLLHSIRDGAGGVFLSVSASLERSPVTAYFDFEAAWTKIAGFPGFAAYPQAYPRAAIPRTELRAPTGAERDALQIAVQAGRIDTRLSRRLVGRGWIEPREFLNPIALARDASDFPTGVTFLHGQIQPQRSAGDLFREIVTEVGVTPFLFSSDGTSVLIGALRRSYSTTPETPTTLTGQSLAVLGKFLSSISVIEEDLREFDVPVDHRYDRLLTSES